MNSNIIAMKKNLLIIFILSIAAQLHAQKNSLGIFDDQTDVGYVPLKGSCTYNASTQQYTIVGSGQNIWAKHDDFHFVWKKMKGDFILRTNGMFTSKGVEEHRKWGWMIRASLDSSSPHANAVVHGNGLTSLQFRRTTGDTTQERRSTLTNADVIELERKGTTIIMRVAHSGETFTSDSIDLDLGDEVYVGLFVCSHNASVSETAVFHNVRIVIPAPSTLVPYRQYLGSQLEILDVANGNSKIIFQSPRSIQAPNYIDGKHLIYNSDGLIYKFDIAATTPTVLNTGSVKNCNNDHVISWDGKALGISSSETPNGPSLVWTVPMTGGEPKKITATGPSYLHGWSTDNKDLVFVGQRNGEFDIYKISANGGEETRLTTAKGLDDGCEYSPDGKYIYFNSARSGSMQIYRMNPDGSNQQQLTNDEWNNWFPHISPDGKWMVFISFGKDVSPSDHPFYKHVYLRLMPVDGGTPKVIAYLYGGQGTINTPCWSPDSKHIAFISNSNFLSPIYPIEKDKH
jgi:TolB protein